MTASEIHEILAAAVVLLLALPAFAVVLMTMMNGR